jgi:hypothetical protein
MPRMIQRTTPHTDDILMRLMDRYVRTERAISVNFRSLV